MDRDGPLWPLTRFISQRGQFREPRSNSLRVSNHQTSSRRLPLPWRKGKQGSTTSSTIENPVPFVDKMAGFQSLEQNVRQNLIPRIVSLCTRGILKVGETNSGPFFRGIRNGSNAGKCLLRESEWERDRDRRRTVSDIADKQSYLRYTGIPVLKSDIPQWKLTYFKNYHQGTFSNTFSLFYN